MSIKIKIKKDFGSFLLNANLESDSNSLALLGASGSGKSLTLKCIAGIIKPDEGYIIINDKTVFDSSKKINLKPQDRKVGYMFQDYALFPNMNVSKNIMCGLKKFSMTKEEKERKVEEIVEMLSLNGLEEKQTYHLSGGQKQRVALARILVNEPSIMLLDEPFSALDEHLKTKVELDTKELLEKQNIPYVLVTHNRDEAYSLCEEISIIEEGSIIIKKKTTDLFKDPEYLSASIITGCKNNVKVILKDEKSINIPDWNIDIDFKKKIKEDTKYVGIRAHAFKESNKRNGYKIEIVDITQEPFEQLVRFRFENQDKDSQPVYWRLPKEIDVSKVQYLTFDKEKVLFLK